MHQSEVPFFRWSRFWEAVVSWPPWRPFRDPPSSEASSLWKMTVTGDYASTSAELLCKNDGSFNFLGREMHWKKPYWANGHIILEAFRVYVWFFILDEEKRATFFFSFFLLCLFATFLSGNSSWAWDDLDRLFGLTDLYRLIRVRISICRCLHQNF